MKKVVKWFLILLAMLAVILIGLFLYARYVVGINVALPGGEFDPGRLEERMVLPDGFSLSVFASNIPNARMLRVTAAGDLLVANPGLGQILLLSGDEDKDGQSDGRRVLIAGLNGPNGMDIRDGWLYVAETDGIVRIRFDEETGVAGPVERIVSGLPAGGNHWQKTLRVGPDDRLYVTVGSSCNVCIEKDSRRAAMVTYLPDGSDERLFAEGLRNSAGFDWSPLDGEIYATDNGRDLLGDNFPPCELNQVRDGNHYGWPYANGDRIPDPDYGDGQIALIARSLPPVHEFRAHNAPLGIRFISGDGLPEEYRGAALVALHGSWNRTEKDGYKVVSLHWGENGVEERDFLTGFLKNDDVIGRPVEIEQDAEGAIYVSDDYAGVVYRIAYGEPQRPLRVSVVASKYNKTATLGAYSELERAELDAEGRELYEQNACQSCHNPVVGMKKLSDLGTRYDVRALQDFLRMPKPPMPVIPMSERETEALAVHLIENY